MTATWLALGGGAASVAHACSAPGPCLTFFGGVQPRDSAVDVIRNVELRIHYAAAQELTRLDVFPTVEDLAGNVVDVVWKRSRATLRGTLRSRLAAQTRYRIRHAFETCSVGAGPGFCAGSGLCPAAVPTTISTFTTGDLVDDARPAPVSFALREATQTSRVTEEAACGPYDTCSYTWNVSSLGAGHTLRLVRQDGEVTDTVTDGELRAAVYSGRIPYGGGTVIVQLGGAHYDAYVVDEAGNLSDSTRLEVPACAPWARSDGPKGGVVADGREEGCSVHRSSAAPAAPFCLVSLMLGLWLRQRARRQGLRRNAARTEP